MSMIIIIGLIILVAIGMIALSVLIFNFMLLLSELNKRLIFIITDILGNIDLATPNLNTLNPILPKDEVEDILKEEEGNTYFNPHEFNIDEYKEENE